MHEILTLQLGQRSNYLATHFWNTQVCLASGKSDLSVNAAAGILFYVLGGRGISRGP